MNSNMMTTQRSQGTGTQTPDAGTVAAILSDIGRDDLKKDIRPFRWPHYAWCGKHLGHRIDMLPVEYRMCGSMQKSSEIFVYVDGKFCFRQQEANGDVAGLAEYLRQGHWDDLGVSLDDHQASVDLGPVVESSVSWESVSQNVRKAIEGVPV
jgi:hypothetical protein